MNNRPIARRRAGRWPCLSLVLLASSTGGAAAQATSLVSPPDLPFVVPNDNRLAAGTLRDGVLTIHLVATMARWAPEGEDGPSAVVAALGEVGGPPRIPAPLIRVPAGTVIEARITNALPDSTLAFHGLMARPATEDVAVEIAPGQTRTIRFEAGAAGSYVYRASPGAVDHDVREREQLAGALIVDGPGEPTDDRVFVINIWGEPRDSSDYRNAVAINGLSWPHTEPIDAAVGDTLRWRVLNASARNHPMHLHGFYFAVEARGDLLRDTTFAAGERRLAVTEDLSADHTVRMVWVPERPGNWLFHCHLSFHVIDGARLEPVGAQSTHSDDPLHHMAGLVLGIAVHPTPGWQAPERGAARHLRLLVQEGRATRHAPRALGYVLQEGSVPPARDSVAIPGSRIVLVRGEPTDITVVNRLAESTAVHWHGIELESFSDGVAGWSGEAGHLAPAIAPGDSFTARLTVPRAGTFIYHTHLNDVEQLTSGLYGGLIVLEPGQRDDPDHDHLFVAGWDGDDEPPHIVVQGDSVAASLQWIAGEAHRLRFVNIGPAQRLFFEVRRDTAFAEWRPLAMDGADVSPPAAGASRARVRLAVGQTFDAELRPLEPGDYTLFVRMPGGAVVFRQPIAVRRGLVPKVLVIGIDGVRPDVLAEVATPNIDRLIAEGTFSASARTTRPTMSGPGWSSLLTGVWPAKHGVTSNAFIGRRFDRYPDFLTRIERVEPDLNTFAALDWLPLGADTLGGPVIGDAPDAKYVVNGYSFASWAAADSAVVARAVTQLRDSDVDAAFVYLGNPDEVSHETHSIGAPYRDAIALADAHIGELLAAVRARPSYAREDWLIIVSTDHGRRADGGHGGDTPEESTIFYLASGPSAARGAPAERPDIVDVAATALTHLGFRLDPDWQLDGRPVGLQP